MINSNEVRAGNYVLYTPNPDMIELQGGNVDLLSELKRLGANFEMGTTKVHNVKNGLINDLPESYFSPIALTPRLIEHFGFIPEIGGPYLVKDGVKILEGFDKEQGIFQYQVVVNFNDGSMKIYFLKWVHELQNMFEVILEKPLKIDL